VRAPFKTSPDGHRTAPLSRGPGSVPPPPLAPVLVVLSGPQVGERIRIATRVEVGRDPRAALRLRDPGVALHHLIVEPTSRVDRWKVTDMGGGATQLNGTPLSARAALLVAAQDEILVGQTVLRIELHDEVEQEFDRVVVERLHRDDLTGLLSRRKFEQELASLLELGSEAGPVALVLLDVDGVKKVNDAHGHLAGAAVIAHVGRVLARTVGSRGQCARLGGDELAVLLTTGRDDAVEIAEAILEAVRFSPCEHEGQRHAVTVSAGVAWRPASYEQLMRVADGALFDAKRVGGDTVIAER